MVYSQPALNLRPELGSDDLTLICITVKAVDFSSVHHGALPYFATAESQLIVEPLLE
jgi:hypothetical protein